MADRKDPKYWGRVGGLTAWSRNGSDVMLAGARRGFRARFARLVDPNGILPASERDRRIDRAIRAHMLTLAAKSAERRAGRSPPGFRG